MCICVFLFIFIFSSRERERTAKVGDELNAEKTAGNNEMRSGRPRQKQIDVSLLAWP